MNRVYKNKILNKDDNVNKKRTKKKTYFVNK